LGMTLTAHRFRAAWALMCIPLAASALRGAAAWTEDGLGLRLAALSVVLVPAALWWGEPGPTLRWDRTSVPVDATGAMEELDLRGPLFNDYDGGGWIGWARPEVAVFIDGRTPPFFTDDHFYAARAALDDAAVFRRLDAGYGFTAAVVPVDAPLAPALSDDPAWRAAWTGSRRVLFLREPASRPVPDAGVASPQPPK